MCPTNTSRTHPHWLACALVGSMGLARPQEGIALRGHQGGCTATLGPGTLARALNLLLCNLAEKQKDSNFISFLAVGSSVVTRVEQTNMEGASSNVSRFQDL